MSPTLQVSSVAQAVSTVTFLFSHTAPVVVPGSAGAPMCTSSMSFSERSAAGSSNEWLGQGQYLRGGGGCFCRRPCIPRTPASIAIIKTTTGQDVDAEPVGDDYEEEEEEDDDDEEIDSGGEEIVGTTQHWTDEEAEAALAEVRKWIAWQGYVPLKQVVWRGPRCCGQSRPLSSRQLDRIRGFRGLVVEVQTYLLDMQGIFACSAAMSFAFYRCR